MNQRPTFVYFFTRKRKYPSLTGKIRVKIGIAFDVDRRKRQLQTGRETLLVQYRPPLIFFDRNKAIDFETWAHNYASVRGRRLVFPGGKEFFELSPRVIGEIVAKYRELTGRSTFRFFIPKPVRLCLGILYLAFLGISLPLRPVVWISTIVGIYCREKYGITPAGWLLSHLLIFFCVLIIRVCRIIRMPLSLLWGVISIKGFLSGSGSRVA